jgi:hypothetical protein
LLQRPKKTTPIPFRDPIKRQHTERLAKIDLQKIAKENKPGILRKETCQVRKRKKGMEFKRKMSGEKVLYLKTTSAVGYTTGDGRYS